MTPNLLELGGSRPAKPLSGTGPDNSPYRSGTSSSSSGAGGGAGGYGSSCLLHQVSCIVMQLILMLAWTRAGRVEGRGGGGGVIMHGCGGGLGT